MAEAQQHGNLERNDLGGEIEFVCGRLDCGNKFNASFFLSSGMVRGASAKPAINSLVNSKMFILNHHDAVVDNKLNILWD